MEFKETIKKEFANFTVLEKVFFPLVILITVIISFVLKDNKIALISAICGISYTILAGKGRISCFFIGIIGTFCYCYISFKNFLYGQLALYALYYFPMELAGIYKWSRHLKKDTREIEKTHLTNKERYFYLTICSVISVILAYILKYTGDMKPFFDAFAVVFSILGQYLTVKRCIEQWYIWFFVNLISLIMWIYAYINGSNCIATVIMWFVYLLLAIYFLHKWEKEIKGE